ncbi:deoxyribonuclease-1-like 1 [Plectropomus leopardus]|uniref:deoxyribonuclease-1-like 1 n=1 Tax=Plectropomus leopardus TaxID=160734 RepID=UPI001C4AF589|nr:deoxyribonuclease-1-like 1 [Plectropomus leopardus]
MKIAAFNVKKLGKKKVNDPFVRSHLIKIVSRYSVVVMLEVVDKSNTVMKNFLIQLNKYGRNKQHPYSMQDSKPLGRDTYKEKFVYLFRYEVNNSLQMKAEYIVQKLVLIPVHTKPKDTVTEMEALQDVVQAVRKKWQTDNIMILGDFNADGRYLSQKKKKIRISSAPYHWLIQDDVDTTTSNWNDHTYDRIVVYGKTMLNAVVQNSAKPFNFQREFKLTDQEASEISDHYPVEVELKTKPTKGNTHKKAGAQKKTAGPAKRKAGPSTDTPAKRRRGDL